MSSKEDDNKKMNLQIGRIKEKLNKLKRKDSGRVIFGASKHRYKFFRTKTEAELIDFEERFKIRLPESYRIFIKEIGNGGGGPYYGLEQLEAGIFSDLDYKNEAGYIDPSKEFLFTEAWNLDLNEMAEGEDYSQREEVYYDNKWANGLLRICNFGCGVSINLVVNGIEYGNIWVDDRCNDGGIYPDHYFGNTEKIDFLTWYELWLDQSLKELGW